MNLLEYITHFDLLGWLANPLSTREPESPPDRPLHRLDETQLRLHTLLLKIIELGAAHARGIERLRNGRSVRELIDQLYLVIRGVQSQDAIDRIHIIAAIEGAAHDAADLIEREDQPAAIDRFLFDLVVGHHMLSSEVRDGFSTNPELVARAVRLWARGARRPRASEPTGSKWDAIAGVMKLAGLPMVSGKAIERAWDKAESPVIKQADLNWKTTQD